MRRSMMRFAKVRIFVSMGIWLAFLALLMTWVDRDAIRAERQQAFKTARAFFQQILISRAWNASHGGVYVPITERTPPNEYLAPEGRDITTDNGMRLTRINPAYMTRQMGEIAEKSQGGIRFHITSLNPIRPDNAPTDWERDWLETFTQGVNEQGEIFVDGATTWFRYMAPLVTKQECLRCHAQQGYSEGDIRGGISVILPFTSHNRMTLYGGFAAVAVVGLLVIFIGGAMFERKRLLFDATFNSTVPTCVTGTDHTILMANDSYWTEFGACDHAASLKCYEHRPGPACHTDNCPLERIKSGSARYVCEPSKEKDGITRHYIVTAKPLLDAKEKVVGIVESFLDITDRKTLEREKEKLIAELQASLEKVKTLSGLIPICASCKQVRDDQGYWSQVEAYVARYSEAQFSHSICPGCLKKLYPEFADEILRNAGLNEN